MDLRKGVRDLFTGSLAGRSIGFLANVAISRALGPFGLGILGLILTTTQTFDMLVRGGVDYSLVCRWTELRGNVEGEQELAEVAKKVVRINAALLLIALGIWTLGMQGLVPVEIPQRKLVCLIVLVTCIVETWSTISWDVLTLKGKTKIVSMRQGIFVPIKLGLTLVGALVMGTTLALIGYMSGAVLQWAWLEKRTKEGYKSSGLMREAGIAMDLVSRGFTFFTTNAISSFVFLPMLGELATQGGIEQVGYLRVGQLGVQVFGLIPGAIAPLLFITERKARVESMIDGRSVKALKFVWLSGLAGIVGYFLCDRWLISTIVGVEYTGAVMATRLLVYIAVIEGIGQLLHIPILANEDRRFYAIVENISAIIAGVLGFRLVHTLGVQGFLIAKLVYAGIPTIIYLGYSWKRISDDLVFVPIVTATIGLGYLSVTSTVDMNILVPVGLGIMCMILMDWKKGVSGGGI